MRFSSVAFGIVGLFFLTTPFSTQADTINVTTTSDELDGIGAGNGCSIREAIQAANTDRDVGGCPAGAGGDTINLPSGTYTLTRVGEESNNASGNLNIRSSITIVGPTTGAPAIIQKDPSDQTVETRGGVVTATSNNINVQISDITIQNGVAREGGGLYLNGSSLTVTLTRVTLRRNRADENGGGVYLTVNTNLSLQESDVMNNQAVCRGGGIHVATAQSTLTINTSNISYNEVLPIQNNSPCSLERHDGGGIFNQSANFRVERSTIDYNSAGRDGGGIYNFMNASMTLNNTTVAFNNAYRHGGGIYSSGGAILRQTTITQNAANYNYSGGGQGGGLYVNYGTAAIGHSLLVGNANDGAPGVAPNCAASAGPLGSITSLGSNIIDNTAGCSWVPGLQDQIGIPSNLLEFGRYGGRTFVFPLISDNPAVNAGADALCLETDQRNFSRARPCEIGAFEITCNDGHIARPPIELCDDGDPAGGPCNATCSNAVCGDYVTAGEETCDDGDRNGSPNQCNTQCSGLTTPVCGNRIVERGETCDDPLGRNGQPLLCSNSCNGITPAVCGNAVQEAGEICDRGINGSRDCDADCTLVVCGDGFRNPSAGEGCDDGNQNNLDACRNNCRAPYCGDGIVDSNEGCDDGNTIDTDACRSNCVPAACGDGIVQAGGEECDENRSDTLPNACRMNCRFPHCGDGVVDNDILETCDDENTVTEICDYNSQSCTICASNCALQPGATSFCGDGRVDEANGETCDDGNQNDNDACPNNCRTPLCGNGVPEGTEACDTAISSATCDFDCTLVVCGDGVWNQNAGEACDDGTRNSDTEPNVCRRSNCQLPRCGDGVTDNREGCDDGNTNDRDACRNDCTSATCGDGVTQENVEECDNGRLLNGNDPNSCRANCLLPTCGDGVRDRGEGCDNGADDSDTVSNACRLDCREPFCGDSVMDDGEGCDDGNQNNMDACRNNCSAATCGDGVVQEGMEQCDEGDQNRNEPNVCRATCVLPVCGDGIRDQNEQCDDGNIIDTDTCSSACRTVVREAGFLPGGAVTQGGDQAPAQPAQPAQPASPGGGCSLIISR